MSPSIIGIGCVVSAEDEDGKDIYIYLYSTASGF